jgi:hypothetical protein
LTENNTLTSEQFGFREKSTTDMAAYVLLNNIQLSLEKKKTCGWNILWSPKGIWLCKSWHVPRKNETLWNHRCSLKINEIIPK